MSLAENSVGLKAAARPAWIARAVYTAAIFSSAFLMFAIQPMFTKMVLPQLGGSPGVWSVAMVFFQGLLLLGYLYAHLSTRFLPVRAGVALHVAMLVITLVALPIAMSTTLGSPPAEGQVFWLIGTFALSVGLPFFAISGNGPLLQAWFARTGHPHAANPYFLYAASNLGSFAALLLYPLVFETTLHLSVQSAAWSQAFSILAILITGCGYLALTGHNTSPLGAESTEPAPDWTQIGRYIWLALVPSGLLVAVTAYISTDVAAAPFLWIIPLSLFLLTFVLIFRDNQVISPRFLNRALPTLAAMIVITKILDPNILISTAVHLTFFFVAALFCHQRLFEQRPAAAHLTQFYLWMSFGGVLGGIFSALIAPLVFNRVLEYPLLACIVMLAHPALHKPADGVLFKQALPVICIAIVAVLGLQVFSGREDVHNGFLPVIVLMLGSFAIIALYRLPVIQAALIPCLFIFSEATFANIFNAHFDRSFFGVHQLSLRENDQFRVLTHGLTIHGAQRVANADGTPYTGPVKPLTYYHPDGLLAQTLRLTPPKSGGRNVGVVGLGSGAHSCNGQPGDKWQYFEIDPVVERIARDTANFTFLSTCAPDAKVTIGDARLTLADEPHGKLDYLLIDAFSSDAIPVHLLTREALQLYMDKLAPDGLLAVHISNQHMELETVVAALADDGGYALKVNKIASSGRTLEEPTAAVAAVFAKQPETLIPFSEEGGWARPSATATAVWTDDYSNIPGAIWRKYMR